MTTEKTLGNCPKCDEEIEYFSKDIFKKCSKGHEIHKQDAIRANQELTKRKNNPVEFDSKQIERFSKRIYALIDEVNEFYESEKIKSLSLDEKTI